MQSLLVFAEREPLEGSSFFLLFHSSIDFLYCKYSFSFISMLQYIIFLYFFVFFSIWVFFWGFLEGFGFRWRFQWLEMVSFLFESLVFIQMGKSCRSILDYDDVSLPLWSLRCHSDICMAHPL